MQTPHARNHGTDLNPSPRGMSNSLNHDATVPPPKKWVPFIAITNFLLSVTNLTTE